MNNKRISAVAAMTKKNLTRLLNTKTSGSESMFSYEPWGTTGIHANNCYDYAIGDYRPFRNVKSSPGDRAGMQPINGKLRTCAGLKKRVLADNPGNVYLCKNPNTPCKRGFYKIMMFVAPTNDVGEPTGDFHFYKQHHLIKYKCKANDTVRSLARFFEVPDSVIKKSGTVGPGRILKIPVMAWSHKLGWGTGPLLVDSNNRVIKDPRTAGKDYQYNYTDFCSAFCVRRGKARSGSSQSLQKFL